MILSHGQDIKFSNDRLAEEVRYGIIFLSLTYKHVWALSYTYRVLISPIDKSSE